jgi:hypothetical protein
MSVNTQELTPPDESIKPSICNEKLQYEEGYIQQLSDHSS